MWSAARRREQYLAGCGTIGKRERERGQGIQPTTKTASRSSS
jgi:hypothetical protein